MTQFMLAHPWMTFWLVVIGLLLLDNIGCSFADAIKKRRSRHAR